MASLSRESVLDSFLVYQNSFTLGARFGRWTQEARPCTQDPDARLWTMDAGLLWTLDAGGGTLGTESQTIDVKTSKFKTVQNFGTNGAISVILMLLDSALIKIFSHLSSENKSTVY